MEVDAATRWVAPLFISAPGQEGRPGMVWILNLGPGPAKVSVTFYDLDGLPRPVSTKNVEAGTIEHFGVSELFVGWLRVDSDKPVFPYADCLAAGTAFGKYVVPVSFYRAEGLGTEEWVREPGEMVAVPRLSRESTERRARRAETILKSQM